MNDIRKNHNFAARQPNPLIRVWRLSGDPGIPLTSTWVRADITPLRPMVTIRRTAR